MDITEDNYVAGLQAKNEKALKFFIEHDGWIVKSIVHKMMAKYQDKQEECMNDIFFQVWNNIQYFDCMKNSFKNWIAGVSRYRAIDCLRKHRRELEVENIEDVAAAKEEEAYQRLVDQEISRELEQMLSCLNPRDQELFRRLYIEEQDISQVSREMGMQESAVYNHVSRGKRKIRNLYPREQKER